MKTSILVAAIIAGALSAPIASAQDKHVHPKPAAGMDMDKHMGEMQQKMKAMQVQMDTIRKTTDPRLSVLRTLRRPAPRSMRRSAVS